MLAKLPGVVASKKLNSTNFTVAKKVFAFTKGEAVVLKLPQPVIQRLVEEGTATRLIMGKRVMKEWAVIRRPKPTDFKSDWGMFEESFAFVAAGAGKKKRTSGEVMDGLR